LDGINSPLDAGNGQAKAVEISVVSTGGIEFHEFAAVFPLMDEADLQALADDIRQRGQQEQIIRFEGKILDGRNRYTACRLAGVEPSMWDFKGSREEALHFVWSENYHRRHLTSSQQAGCVADYERINAGMIEATKAAAKERQRKGGGDKRSAKAKSVSQKVDEPIQQDNAQRTDAKIAQATGTNRQYVADARKIAAANPELLEEVKQGKKTIPQAKREVINKQKIQELEQKAAAVEFSAEQPPWTLIHADVMDGLQSILDHHAPARLVFADPPYNIGVDYGDGEKADLLPDHRYMMWVREWLDLSKEVLSPDGSLWVMIGDEYAGEYAVALKDLGLTIRAWIKWYETFGVNCSNNFNRCSRHIFYAVQDPKSFVFHSEAVRRPSDRQTKYNDKRADSNGKIEDDVWQISRLTGTATERIPGFPTQLPLQLVQRIVCCASDPGDLVVDPFSGSATTGVAAIQNQRKYVGIEKSREFIEISDKRLKVAT
jgi:DNA modification methylase/ParB-like chromosome segregation protein Spo0J